MGKIADNKNRNRRLILDAAFALFADQGLAQTSIADVVTASGLARGTFYNYFISLEEVWSALMEEHFAAIGRQARESRQSAKNVHDFFADAYRSYFEMVVGTPKMLPFVVRNQPAIRESFDSGPAPTTIFQQLEEDMLASGFFSHLNDHQIRILTFAMVGAVSELLAQSVARGIDLNPKVLSDTLANLFVHGLKGSSNGD